jgi:hypothetical protein
LDFQNGGILSETLDTCDVVSWLFSCLDILFDVGVTNVEKRTL